MKYFEKKIVEDNKLLKHISVSELVQKAGFNKSYASRVKSGKLIVSKEQYLRIKEAIYNS